MSVKIWSGVLFLAMGLEAWGVSEPSVLQEAALWLDAANPAYFEFNSSGGVAKWINRSTSGRTTYGDAEAYLVDTRSGVKSGGVRYGAVARVNGVPAYQMFGNGSDVDMQFTRISTIRTVFLVGTFSTENKLSPLLGDYTYRDFHRGSNGTLWSSKWASENGGYTGTLTFFLNSDSTTCDAGSTTPVANAVNIITIEASADARANSLSRDRNTQQDRNAGRALSEVLVFTRALTAEERVAVYNYLDSKWKNGGWNTGAYASLAAPQEYADDATIATPALFDSAGAVSVASGKTVTFTSGATGQDLNFTGGGTFKAEGVASFVGNFTQAGGTVDFGGGGIDAQANPTLSGDVRWQNGSVRLDFGDEFRPAADTTLTLGNGACVLKHARVVGTTSARTHIDKGNVTLNLEAGSFMDVGGPFYVSIDSPTKNYLNINGGTLVVTNNLDDASRQHGRAITIGSQAQTSGDAVAEGFMTMTSGRILTERLRCAASWGGAGQQPVKAHGTITLNGGVIDLSENIEIGTSHATRGLATVVLNGGEVTAPSGVLMFNDDIDTLTLNGVTFHATADKANYFDLRRSNGANTSFGANGLKLDVASGKTVGIGWGFKGTGGLTKQGTGTLTLDKSATFSGGLSVEAGTVKLTAGNAAGTGAIQLATGATLEVAVMGQPNTLSAASACTLKFVRANSGKTAVMPVANDFTLDGKTIVTYDTNGAEIPTATATVEGGTLYSVVPETLTAAVTDGTTSDWYALAWQRGGTSVSYPTTAGGVVDAVVTAAGTSSVTLGQTVHATTVSYVNSGDGVVTMLSGANTLDANLDLTGFNGDFRLNATPVSGTISYADKSCLVLYATAGQEWEVNQTLSGTAVVRKGGAGTVVWPGFPDRTFNVEEGIFAFKVTSNSSTTPNLTGAGAKEKRGAGTLQFNGGSFAGPWRVTEGTLVVNCDFTSAGKDIYVGPDAKMQVSHSMWKNNRLPLGAQVVVDGGTFEVGGNNPFPTDTVANAPEFFVTNGTFAVLNTTGNEHIKFKRVTLKDSTFIVKGDKKAVDNCAIYMYPAYDIVSDGAVEMVFESASCPNSLNANGDMTLAVNSGTNLFAVSTIRTINKTGAGMIRFPTTVKNNATAYLNVNEGRVGGGQIKYLGLAAGVTLVPDVENPLVVATGITLPSEGTVTVDLSGLDFDHLTNVTVVKYPGAQSSDASKFTFSGLPINWKVSVTDGVYLIKNDVPKALTWNSGSGAWSATEWNNATLAFIDSYHTVSFADAEGGTAGATATVTVNEARAVESLDLSATQTPYAFTGTGSIRAPSFAPTGTAGFTLGVPLDLYTGGITFETTTADQEIAAIRGTIGAVNVPAAAGGTAVLGFTEGSPKNPGAVTIGAGKTLEFRNNFTTSIKPGVVTADATAKLLVTAPAGGYHLDLTQDSPNMKCGVEVTNRGFLYIESQFNQVLATQENPVWVHGAGSILRYYGKHHQNRFPDDGWIKVTDGGIFTPTGVNPTKQDKSPNIVVSNAYVQVESSSGSTIHTGAVYLEDGAEFKLTGTATAYTDDGYPEGVVIHGTVYARNGTSLFTRVGNSNYAHFQTGSDSTHAKVGGIFDVSANAKLTLSCPLARTPIKTGAGLIELAGDFCTRNTKEITVNGGYVLANAFVSTLTTLTMADGTGFDVSADGACLDLGNAAALQGPENGTIYLKTGSRTLAKGDYLVRWTAGSTVNRKFRFAPGETNGVRFALFRVNDGIKVGGHGIVIMIR